MDIKAMSQEQPLLLVFVRHLGCIFCKEMLGNLEKERESIEKMGIKICVVHMGPEAKIQELLKEYHLQGVETICDPKQELYKKYDVKRARVGQMIGLQSVKSAVKAYFKGYRQYEVLGDSFQLPGAFLVDKGEIIKAFYAEHAGDQPDFCALVKT